MEILLSLPVRLTAAMEAYEGSMQKSGCRFVYECHGKKSADSILVSLLFFGKAPHEAVLVPLPTKSSIDQSLTLYPPIPRFEVLTRWSCGKRREGRFVYTTPRPSITASLYYHLQDVDMWHEEVIHQHGH